MTALHTLASRLSSARAALYAWAGLFCVAHAVSISTGRPEVVWPAALGIGAFAAAVRRMTIEVAASLPAQPTNVVAHPRAQKLPQPQLVPKPGAR